jgi:hypothetical protein
MTKLLVLGLPLLLSAWALNVTAEDSTPWAGSYIDPSVIGYAVNLNADGTVTVTGSGTELYSGTYELKSQQITLIYDSSFRQKQPEPATELGQFDTPFNTLTITRSLNGAPVSRTLRKNSTGP